MTPLRAVWNDPHSGASGDVIIGDQDGVVVVPRPDAVEVSKRGVQRRDKEEVTRKRLSSGEAFTKGIRLRSVEMKIVSREGFTPFGCSRFCSRSKHQVSIKFTRFQSAGCNRSNKNHLEATNFHKFP